MQQGMQQIVEQLAKDAEKKGAEELIEVQIKVMAAAYEKGMAYTNLIVIAGYASFFGLWQITKDKLPDKQVLWAALLMVVSATVFVLFEVTKMFYHSKLLQGLNRIITNPEITNSRTALLQAFSAHNQKINQQTVYWGYWWFFAWIITVFSAIPAIVILMWAFVSEIVGPISAA